MCQTPDQRMQFQCNASINVKPEGKGGGGTQGICGAFDFSEEFLVKIPTVGPQNLVKSDQISPPWGSNILVVVVYILQIILKMSSEK